MVRRCIFVLCISACGGTQSSSPIRSDSDQPRANSSTSWTSLAAADELACVGDEGRFVCAGILVQDFADTSTVELESPIDSLEVDTNGGCVLRDDRLLCFGGTASLLRAEAEAMDPFALVEVARGVGSVQFGPYGSLCYSKDNDAFCAFMEQPPGFDEVEVGVFEQVASGVEAVVRNRDQLCLITTTRQVRCSHSPDETPAPVVGVMSAQRLIIGFGFVCALQDDGHVACWGVDFGEEGATTLPGRFTQIDSSGSNACGITTEDEVVCWGQTLHQIFGGEPLSERVREVPELAGATAVAVVDDGLLALVSGELRWIGNASFEPLGSAISTQQ